MICYIANTKLMMNNNINEEEWSPGRQLVLNTCQHEIITIDLISILIFVERCDFYMTFENDCCELYMFH